MQSTQAKPAAPYYVETRPNEPQATLKDARCLAGREQHNGIYRTLRILQDGEVVDLKRF